MPTDERRSIWDRIGEAILNELKDIIRRYVDRSLRELVKTLLLIIVGIALVAFGFFFAGIGAIIYLSEFMPGYVMKSWLAWGIVGVIMALIGAIFLMRLGRS